MSEYVNNMLLAVPQLNTKIKNWVCDHFFRQIENRFKLKIANLIVRYLCSAWFIIISSTASRSYQAIEMHNPQSFPSNPAAAAVMRQSKPSWKVRRDDSMSSLHKPIQTRQGTSLFTEIHDRSCLAGSHTRVWALNCSNRSSIHWKNPGSRHRMDPCEF